MKKILLLSLCLYCLSSCKKQAQTDSEAVLTFKANGLEYMWKGDVLTDTIGAAILHNKNLSFPEAEGYLLYWKDMRSGNFRELRIAITKDSMLTKSTYRFTDQTSFYTGLLRLGVWNSTGTNVTGADYLNATDSDYISVTIENISNGMVSGVFEASLTDYGAPHTKMNITGGHFRNLRIIE